MKNFKELSENHDDGYEPRSKGEKEFKSIHKIEKKQHPTVDDAVFNGDRPGGKVNKSDHKTSSKEPGEPILKTYKNFMKLGGFGGDSYKNVGNSAGEKAAIMQGSSKIKEGLEQIDELSPRTKAAYVAKRGAQLSSMMYGPNKNYNLLTGRQQANAVKGIKRATRVKEENEVSEEIVNEMNYKAGDLKLNSGEIVKISDSAASALNNTFKRLSLANKVNFHKELIKNKDSYQSIMYFAQRIGGGGAWRHSASAIKARQLPDPAK